MPTRKPNSMVATASPVQISVQRRITLALLLTGTFLVTLDFFIVNVALASMAEDLDASTGMVEWVVAGYGLANAAGLITGGRLGDLYGRRNMLMSGFAIFTLASLACGLAPTIEVLIAARVVQGLGGAMLQPQVLAILGTVFAGESRQWAFGWYGLVLGLAATAGQVIGGALIDADWGGLGWRSCFLINIPIGAAALWLAPRFVPPVPGSRQQRLDIGGALLCTTGLVMILLPLIEGRELGWPAWSWFCLVAAFPVLLAFVRLQQRKESQGAYPLIPMSLWSNKAFVMGLLTTLLFYAGNASFYFVLAQYLQLGLGMSALGAGMMFSVLASGFFATSMASAKLSRLLGRRMLPAGALILTAGHAAQMAVTLQLQGTTALAASGVALLVEGAGIGMVMAPLVATILSGLPATQSGVGSGVLAMVQQTGNALGVALIGLLFYRWVGPDSDTASYVLGFIGSLGYLWLFALAVVFASSLLVKRLQQ